MGESKLMGSQEWEAGRQQSVGAQLWPVGVQGYDRVEHSLLILGSLSLGWGIGNCVGWALSRSVFWGWLIGCWDSWHTGHLWLQCGCDVGLCVELSDVSEVIIDSVSRLCCLDGDISPQEFVVVKGDSNRSINTYILKL